MGTILIFLLENSFSTNFVKTKNKKNKKIFKKSLNIED
jgi:hypothetical protein